MTSEKTVIPHSLLTDFDIQLFLTGKHFRLYEKLGSHAMVLEGKEGTQFAVWAPHAKSVYLMGSFNDWKREQLYLFPRLDASGIWEGFLPGVGHGDFYKYGIVTQKGIVVDRADPYANYWEAPPRTASVVWHTYFEWKDTDWMHNRAQNAGQPARQSVYEMHLGSWRRHADGTVFSYLELAETLPQYLTELGFTHVEMMPVMEHPYEPSWGYQITGFFAPSSRFGLPQDFQTLMQALHLAGIGVILDWVPSHFPTDAHGLGEYDGERIYEHPDPRKGYHNDWKSLIFDYGRPEVRSFLVSNALFWLDRFHADGLRVDAVASILHLDYSRKDGEWVPNEFGGNQNLDAVSLIREMNETVHLNYPDVITIAEESTSWYGVSKKVSEGGLGFDQKWMMGWMNDTLRYFARPPQFRPWHQDEITFSLAYAFSENFMLPLSHDEVVHGKASLLGKMPGDEWQRFANLRTLYGYMFAHPGSKLLFMGAEIGQYKEWNFAEQLDWPLLQFPLHKGIQTLIRAIHKLQIDFPSLWWKSFSPAGFQWMAIDDHQNSILSLVRKGDDSDALVLVIINLQPQALSSYNIGVPLSGVWECILHTDETRFGGSGYPMPKSIKTLALPLHQQLQALPLELPPLSVSFWHCTKIVKSIRKTKVEPGVAVKTKAKVKKQ